MSELTGVKIGDYINNQINLVRIWQYGRSFHIEVTALGKLLTERQYAAQLQVARRGIERDMSVKLYGPVSSGGSNFSRTKVYVLS